MKKAKLQKLILQAKEVYTTKVTALKKLSDNILLAKKNVARSKEDLKAARKKHKDAKKNFRALQKGLKTCKTDQKDAQQQYARLEKKWQKVAKSGNKESKPHRRAPRNRKKPLKPSIKVIPAEEAIAAT